MAEKLRFGFIGCGEIAAMTAASMQKARNAVVTMVMDTNPDLARDLGARLQAASTTDMEEVLHSATVDAVYIATPHHLHAPQVIQAAQAGKHVMVEKPLATTVADGVQMIEACRRAGVALSVCYVMRCIPASVEARKLVQDGAIGTVVGFSIREIFAKKADYWEGGYTGRAKTDWRKYRNTSGGGVLNINISHNLDRLRYITGLEAVRVYAEYATFATPVEVEDMIAVNLRMNNDAIGSVYAASCVPGGSEGAGNAPRADHIYGTAGTLVYSDHLWLASVREAAQPSRAEWREIEIKDRGIDERARYIEEFADAVSAGRRPPITGEDGLAMVKIIQAAYESGRIQLPVAIES